MRMFLAVVLFGGLALASTALMATELAKTKTTPVEEEDASLTDNRLSETERLRAHLWDLSTVEWRRYKQLMQGIRGSISPSIISPIEVLGIHARDDAERQRYAESWVRVMRADVDRILAFQRAYDAASKRMYPNAPLIDVHRLPEKTDSIHTLQSSDRLLFFAELNCPACDLLVKKLLKRVDDVRGVDIYLLGLMPGDDVAVRQWAAFHQIDPERVRNRQVTLNHDGGALKRLTRGQGRAPYLLRRRGGLISPLSASDL